MIEELDAVRAEAFELRKRLIEEDELIRTRLEVAAQKLNQRDAIWKASQPHDQEDGRAFREMRRSINNLLADHLTARSTSSRFKELSSTDDISEADEELAFARADREKLLRQLNTDLPTFRSIVSKIEDELNQIDSLLEARSISLAEVPISSSNAETESEATESKNEPQFRNPFSDLLLQLTDPANRRVFERTPEYKAAGTKLLNLIREINSETDALRLRLRSAREALHWRDERWRSIGPHELVHEKRVNEMKQGINELFDERRIWHDNWNQLLTKEIRDALEPLAVGAV